MLLHPAFDPVAIHLGPFAVRWYGLMYMLGFGAAWLLGRWRASRPPWSQAGWSPLMVDDLITWCVAGLILGARLGYTIFYDFNHFFSHPLDVFKVWHGGMSFHGGLLGIALAGLFFARRKGKTFLEIGDFVCPLAPPGLFAGRMGNFINGELWGRPTDLPWGMVFPDPAAGGLPRHPSQLYEAALEGLVLFAVLWLFSRKPRPTGAVTGVFLLLYGLFRGLVEFVREPDPQLGYLAFDWLTMGQVLSLPMILAGLAALAWAYATSRRAMPKP
ncbi:prolipoprotein diacylglyceryl transferase [Megalodesulfovibrio gigas]|uniref:Phosphatidylglycerol--prolipoprotein diacylglyceryl transferase n=1 Tax=Megalodesulfovibrio gigas (strain ATCC 19364 / DSM 1382 / NCIMB 9332 / VKM B-1759) TaxID=1121448 RepID=T2GB15_MEGG1|nr:prolipoprotein diacylglyceryl transferase [Megalodesulfovibrio gigas]AGW13077.1 putative prolipoprotein diacylglyceryl transferase [Megalodesulfovibrio gigas DSM 1382 = ATCC 19364]